MEVAPRYLGGASFLGRRDPRVLILIPILYSITVAQLEDARLVAAAVAIAFAYYLAAGIPFRQVRRNWGFVAVFVLLIALVNALLVGDRGQGEVHGELLVRAGWFDVTTLTISHGLLLYVNYLGLVATGFPLAFAVRPGDIGVAFAKLGVPANAAFGIDLAFKFIPTLSANLRETRAAQRLRGYQAFQGRNPVAALRGLIPLIVPVTVNALLDAEETIDALNLRGFGSGRRSWLRRLRFGPADWAVVAFFGAGFAAVTGLHLAGALPGPLDFAAALR